MCYNLGFIIDISKIFASTGSFRVWQSNCIIWISLQPTLLPR